MWGVLLDDNFKPEIKTCGSSSEQTENYRFPKEDVFYNWRSHADLLMAEHPLALLDLLELSFTNLPEGNEVQQTPWENLKVMAVPWKGARPGQKTKMNKHLKQFLQFSSDSDALSYVTHVIHSA